jgi:hypothetical protein
MRGTHGLGCSADSDKSRLGEGFDIGAPYGVNYGIDIFDDLDPRVRLSDISDDGDN